MKTIFNVIAIIFSLAAVAVLKMGLAADSTGVELFFALFLFIFAVGFFTGAALHKNPSQKQIKQTLILKFAKIFPIIIIFISALLFLSFYVK